MIRTSDLAAEENWKYIKKIYTDVLKHNGKIVRIKPSTPIVEVEFEVEAWTHKTYFGTSFISLY